MREAFWINMDDKLRQEKLKMWKANLADLEEQLKIIAQKKGAAAAEGDLSENAAYSMAIEDAETTRVRIGEVKKIIRDLEKGSK
ncbi:MAG: hypothetical protein ACD_38C00165G0017 [uncultured bacterium]|uniref:Transcription elongation factor GreA/GreB N-terminal domain-containing protein n=1 Tax=Candidatus Daviesbacteria bacterium GW2011_GWC2_40_12 TaxID=1618431 RepID=A0A0G0QNZ7_9BACT|nr:MAG: hypothetical protein ACD_38C00165G0017 [uncultured bacterium]KKR17049.1 MAG: hypothetical protein UT45_C0003G0079 [Candidatus Daviesbacteria bacterium GW2011_GWA2_39_33]KKR23995.1 MAG: hypothetical protein UT54_C0034G0003 [Candidatus Daviesbacteria bacterium GW2011_GWB1_39_5]KKR42114.1 MAG: hypothetical protein UT77_C0004G0098 [Candidatus Daviesbacteria bacterium GW2011_GWC2_40_12]OGE20880.1 MAG: hypothetical protein A2778_06440 [Candidatus Daviesbacteria bacterium RIFCSPHIGHO2_01_FULL_